VASTTWTTLTNEQADERVTHVYEVLLHMEGALIATGDRESSYQSYLLTGDPAVRMRYTSAEIQNQRNPRATAVGEHESEHDCPVAGRAGARRGSPALVGGVVLATAWRR
jgi:CHASE3 domain sensor protein